MPITHHGVETSIERLADMLKKLARHRKPYEGTFKYMPDRGQFAYHVDIPDLSPDMIVLPQDMRSSA